MCSCWVNTRTMPCLFGGALEQVGGCILKIGHSRVTPQIIKMSICNGRGAISGHIVSKEGVKPDPEKLRAVNDYTQPQSVQQLRQFLGLANYYRKFIQGYAQLAEPLHKLTRKLSQFFWTVECQEAFNNLKTALTSAPILSYPHFQSNLCSNIITSTFSATIYTDASNWAVGAVLSQEVDGKERVVAYYSRQLSKAERNYSTTEREALAAVAAIKEFYPYLYGHKFQLITDHNPLTSI